MPLRTEQNSKSSTGHGQSVAIAPEYGKARLKINQKVSDQYLDKDL
jgi:hypothetical protein